MRCRTPCELAAAAPHREVLVEPLWRGPIRRRIRLGRAHEDLKLRLGICARSASHRVTIDVLAIDAQGVRPRLGAVVVLEHRMREGHVAIDSGERLLVVSAAHSLAVRCCPHVSRAQQHRVLLPVDVLGARVREVARLAPVRLESEVCVVRIACESQVAAGVLAEAILARPLVTYPALWHRHVLKNMQCSAIRGLRLLIGTEDRSRDRREVVGSEREGGVPPTSVDAEAVADVLSARRVRCWRAQEVVIGDEGARRGLLSHPIHRECICLRRRTVLSRDQISELQFGGHGPRPRREVIIRWHRADPVAHCHSVACYGGHNLPSPLALD
mmetsp:Transcript_24198/g.82624  ORF Transcript_24198/g.82624 Transcript_24198/m.82624 type:complete len:328 (-) Transcript_24198:996-1979(-)